VGLFYQAHRAVDDCQALLEVLASELPGAKRPTLAVLLERARRKTMRIWAEQSPFDLKDELKKRGYRWSDGADGRLESWYRDVDEQDQAGEIEFLRKEIYLRDIEHGCRRGAETDISTLLSADILALLLQRSFADQLLWNKLFALSAPYRVAELRPRVTGGRRSGSRPTKPTHRRSRTFRAQSANRR
jgi:hypothetical protein